jgi:hypothetical protein
MMLRSFIVDHRSEILKKAHLRVLSRMPVALGAEHHGLPVFLDQVCEALQRHQGVQRELDQEAMVLSASQHGDEMFHNGLTLTQVVQDYGDARHVVSDLIMDRHWYVSMDDLQVLNSCVDDAIAGAVSEFDRQCNLCTWKGGVERIGMLAHEMRNVIQAASITFESIKRGTVAARGATSVMHERSLKRMNALVERSIADVKLDAGLQCSECVPVRDLLEEVAQEGEMFAKSKGLHLLVRNVQPTVTVLGDRTILGAAITNLLQNAFKFTRPESTVTLRACIDSSRVCIDVEDECGGLPAGSAELLVPFKQQGADRSGLGLGLAICSKAAKASGGDLRSRDLPGRGCVFTLDLPSVG